MRKRIREGILASRLASIVVTLVSIAFSGCLAADDGTIDDDFIETDVEALEIADGSAVYSMGDESSVENPSDRLAAITPGAPWVARHGMTSGGYQQEFDLWASRGFRLTYVSGYTVNGSPRFAALWEQSSGPAYIARHGMTSAQYQQEFNTHVANGFRLVLVNGYTEGGSDRYVAIWHKKSGPAWVARHGLSSSGYQNHFNWYTRQGYRLTHVSGYEVNGSARYAAIWERKSGPAWVARHGLSSAGYQSAFDSYAAQGFRLVHVSGYGVAGTARYAAIWHKENGPAWVARHGMSSPGYQDEFDDAYYQGFRPVLVSGYTIAGGQDRYAALWHNQAFTGSELSAIDAVAEDAMADWSLPALSLAIGHEGRLVFAKSYGQADTAAFEKARTKHRFRIASVSKPITSVAIMRLVDDGVLDLDDTVFGATGLLGTIYGSTPYGRGIEDITVRHLLSHTSGGWPNDGSDPMFSNPGMDHQQLISWTLDNRPLNTDPGVVSDYSNFGFCVLGRVIEAVTGENYDTWVRDNVLSPSGISQMEIGGDTLAERKPNEVVYYDGGSIWPYNMQVARMDSHGGWIARPIDLVRLAVRVDGFATKTDILSSGAIDTMTTPWAPGASYALGWAVNAADNWWHTGGLPGTASVFVRTSGEFTWAAATNSRQNGPNLDGMMWDVVNSIPAWPSHDLF